MQNQRTANCIQVHRRKSGLSQRELGHILGYNSDGPVRRHETVRCLPPLLIALGYSIVFKISVTELFGGLQESVVQVVEARLGELESALREKHGVKPRSILAAKKLAWLSNRAAWDVDDSE